MSEFVKKLPVRKISGIGNVSEQLLTKALDVKSCGDMYEQRGYIRLLFGQASADFFLRASLGQAYSITFCIPNDWCFKIKTFVGYKKVRFVLSPYLAFTNVVTKIILRRKTVTCDHFRIQSMNTYFTLVIQYL